MTRAEALRQRFEVWGRYYEAELDGHRYELRSHLEIFDRSVGWPEAARAGAGLVAVMMNPGGSRPLAALDRDGWAPALPDRTQYQLMKVALRVGIRHIRVINLSDLRTPKSAQLFATLATLRDDRHSIFSPRRHDELGRSLGGRTTPLLRAWGMAAALEPLARAAIHATQQQPVLGLTQDGIRYRHPLPQRADLQQQWLEDMNKQIGSVLKHP